MTTDVLAHQASLRGAVGAVPLARDVVRVGGPDAVAYLQGQLSQEVAALAVGGSAWSFLLQPQGKVDAFLRVTRTDDDVFVLDVDGGWGEPVLARLQRFKLRIKADLEALPWRCLALRGPGAHDLDVTGPGVLAVPADWPGLPGVDLLGDDPPVPAGVPVCDPAAYEAVRIEAGVPVMGRELGERTIPAEAGVVDRAVSFTKGCYTGQELVARVDARGGNVPRHLRGVVVDGDVTPPAGAALVDGDGAEVGVLTSTATSAALGRPVALAYVRRQVTPPAAVTVRWDDGEAPGRVEVLPLVG